MDFIKVNKNFCCRAYLPQNIKIRLRGGRVATEGRVEIQNPQGRWITICGDGWSLLEAIVVCKMMGMGK